MPSPISPVARTVRKVRFSWLHTIFVVSPYPVSPLKHRPSESEQLMQHLEIATTLFGGSIPAYTAEATELRGKNASSLTREERLARTDLCPVRADAILPPVTLASVDNSSLHKRRASKSQSLPLCGSKPQ